MIAAEKILFIIMISIILGMSVVIIILGLAGSGYKQIRHKLITAKGDPNRRRYGYRIIKRCFDIIFSLGAVIVTLPLILITILLIRLSGKNKALARYDCIGSGGRKAYYSKLDTTDHSSNLLLAIDRMGLDALPMFVAVLRGDLTIIGLSRIGYEYVDEKRANQYHYEKPGFVTIGSQFKILGKSDEDVDKMYLRTRSVSLDISIMFYLFRQVLVTPVK